MSSYSPETDEPKSFTAAWIATVLLIVIYIIGLLIFPPLYEDPSGEVSSFVLFIGRFHPILLHLPVGILALLCLFELICSTRRGEQKFGEASLLMLLLGAAGAELAVFAGIMLSREGGYAGGNFTLHQTMALLGTAGVLIALVIRLAAMGRGSWELLNAYRAVYFISFGIMGLGAHFGGNMSHGNKFLTQHAPEWLKAPMVAMEKWMLGFVEKPKPEKTPPSADVKPEVKPEVKTEPPMDKGGTPPPVTPPAPAPAPAGGEKLVFQDVILPILTAKCNKCHSEEKSKGDLRMDTYEMAMKGGENGSNFVAGNLKDSLSISRIMLPDSDDEHMPPDGKDQLTPEEIALLKWWVEQGASGTQKVKDAKFPAELQATVDGILKG
ncbi:c-type cytochrome domain-containing protein [Prosthecobacter sp.]|uniref:c-type cytochrome domain-containing protein n=1 Tax=Prosthecobacter sp. TaxID=1965333 RepID=UPI003785236C